MTTLIHRENHLESIQELLRHNPAVALLGPRQVGKTTLANTIGQNQDAYHYFDLELPADRARLAEPELAFDELEGLLVLDEIQLAPNLFPTLRSYIDKNPKKKFLLLGSASPHLLKQSSETLAGRVAFYNLPPFNIEEVRSTSYWPLWLRGGFPRSYLAANEGASFTWRLNFIKTFIERDLPQLGSKVPSTTHDRFWRMLANLHGQTLNTSSIARSFGVSDTTIRSYLDLLTSALVVQQLRPWHQSANKRLVKSPKIYIVDSGLLHALLDIEDRTQLERHPVIGHSWEGFVINQIKAILSLRNEQTYFWGVRSGAEIDLVITRNQERIGFEIKRTTSPNYTKALRSAVRTLELDKTYLIHAGEENFPLDKTVTAVSFNKLQSTLTNL